MRHDGRNKEVRNPSLAKKRRPLLSSLLSFISLGMGQIYNGELLKGILLKIVLVFSIGLYMFLNLKTAKGLVFLTLLLVLFILLKIYSIIQAFVKSRQTGSAYVLKKFNKAYVYLILILVFLALNLAIPMTLPNRMLVENNSYHPFRSAKAKERYLERYDSIAKNWPVDSETREIDTSYGRTFIRISGPADASPLVLLPGAGTSSLLWARNIGALAGSFRTYAVDSIYDFGRSVFIRKLKTPEDLVQWLDELFNTLGLGNNINLMGLSYGGWMTSQYALHHQNRLEKIVLLAPAATVADFSWGFILRGIRLWLWPYRSSYREFMTWALGDIEQNKNEGLELIEEETEIEFLAMRSFKPKMPASPTVLTDEQWRSLEVPILYMVGENEVIYSISAEEVVSRLNKNVPQIETELIPNAGHGFTSLQADIVNQKVLEFLKKD
jgi:pimeloyl-ACP methyl ester carboxylesterase